MSKTVKEGDWILRESYMRNLFSHPCKVVKVSGQRVYWMRPALEREKVQEGYCHIKTVLYTAPSQEAGLAMFDEQIKLSKILAAEEAAAAKRFYEGVFAFIKANGGVRL